MLACVCILAVPLVFAIIGYFIGKEKTAGPWVCALICGLFGILGIVVVAFALQEKAISRRHRPRRRGRRSPRRADPGEDEEIVAEEAFELRFSCPHCGKKYCITDPAQAGLKARCGGCGKTYIIPKPA